MHVNCGTKDRVNKQTCYRKSINIIPEAVQE